MFRDRGGQTWLLLKQGVPCEHSQLGETRKEGGLEGCNARLVRKGSTSTSIFSL